MTVKNKNMILHISVIMIFLAIPLAILRYFIIHHNIIPSYRDIIFPVNTSYVYHLCRYVWNPSMGLSLDPRCWFDCAVLYMSSRNIYLYTRLYLLLIYFLSLLFSYLGFYRILKTFARIDMIICPLYAMSLSLVYVFNPFTVHEWTPPLVYVLAYSLFPLLFIEFYYILRIIFNNDHHTLLLIVKSIVIAIIYSAILTIGTPRYGLIALLIVLIEVMLFVLFHIKTNITTCVYGSLKRIMLFLVIFATVFVCLNMYWILPLTQIIMYHVSMHAIKYIVTIESFRMFSSAYSLVKIFSLSAIWWPYLSLNTDTLYEILIIIINVIVVSFTICKFVSVNKSLKLLTVLGATYYTIGIYLWHGMQGVSSYFYLYLIKLMPTSLLWIFRVPEHFATIMLFGYALILITFLILVKELLNTLKKKRLSMKLVTYIFISFIVIAITFPGISIIYCDGHLKPLRSGYSMTESIQLSKEIFSNPNVRALYLRIKSMIPLSVPNDLQWLRADFLGVDNNFNAFMAKTMPQNLKNAYLLRQYMEKLNAILGINSIVFNDPGLPFRSRVYNSIKLYQLAKPGIYLVTDSASRASVISLKRTCYLISNDLAFLDIISENLLKNAVLIPITPRLNSSLLEYCNGVIVLDDTLYWYLPLLLNKNSIIIAPSKYVNHYSPAYLWSKTYTHDPIQGPWHPVLNKWKILNWQGDYNLGIVFTWSKYRTILASTAEKTIKEWNFANTCDCIEWKRHTLLRQHKALQVINCNGKTLTAELLNSTYGWKTVNSPLIPIKAGHAYRIILTIKGINAYKVHIKVALFTRERKLITVKYLSYIGSGTFKWKNIAVNFINNYDAYYMQIQIWYGYKTTTPLPNIIILRRVIVYDITKYSHKNVLDIPFEVTSPGKYIVFIRCYMNSKGGELKVYINNVSLALIRTKDFNNEFRWIKVGDIYLSTGKHTISVENVQGFNAINTIILIPSHVFYNTIKHLNRLLQNKMIYYYIIKPIQPLCTTNRRYTYTSLVYIPKSGKYFLAIRMKGQAKIVLNNKSYLIISSSVNKSVIIPVFLGRGILTLKIVINRNTCIRSLIISTQNELSKLEPLRIKVVAIKYIDPTLIIVKLEGQGSAWLTLNEPYSRLWKIRIITSTPKRNIKILTINSLPGYGLVNTFPINVSNKVILFISFKLQRTYDVGRWCSFLTLVMCTIIAMVFHIGRRAKNETRNR